MENFLYDFIDWIDILDECDEEKEDCEQKLLKKENIITQKLGEIIPEVKVQDVKYYRFFHGENYESFSISYFINFVLLKLNDYYYVFPLYENDKNNIIKEIISRIAKKRNMDIHWIDWRNLMKEKYEEIIEFLENEMPAVRVVYEEKWHV